MGDWQPGEDVELGVLRPDLERDGCLQVNTGGFDPVARLTYQEQAALALNAHLTQGAGSVPTPGDYYLYLRLAEVAPGSRPDRCDRALRRASTPPSPGSPTIPVTRPTSRCAASSSSWASLAEASSGRDSRSTSRGEPVAICSSSTALPGAHRAPRYVWAPGVSRKALERYLVQSRPMPRRRRPAALDPRRGRSERIA